MRKLVFLFLLLVALFLAPLLLIHSETTLIKLAYWAVDRFTDLRLELKSPVLRPFQGIASADEIHLYPKDNSGPPFLSVLDFSGDISVSDVYAADLEETSLRARQVIVYVSDRDATEDPTPVGWLKHLTWLPGRLEVQQMHVVTAAKDTSILALRNLQGKRDAGDRFDVSAEAAYADRKLLVGLELRTLRMEGGNAGLGLYGTFGSPARGVEFELEGELRGTQEEFSYDFKLDGHCTDVADIAPNLNSKRPLKGRLDVHGTMRGDTEGFILSDAYFLLDNLPDYGIEAAGSLDYDWDGKNAIELVAAGELSSMEPLLDWVDFDLRPLGKAQGNATIHGSLEQPVIDKILLRSESDSGLTVNISGLLDTGAEARRDNRVTVDIQAPRLAVLEHWTGALPYESGAFSASATLVGEKGRVALENLVVELGDRDTVALRLTGSAQRISPPSESGSGAISGLELLAKIHSQDSANLAQLLHTSVIPAGFTVEGQIRFFGDSQRLDAEAGLVTASSSDIELRLRPRQLVFRPADPTPLSEFAADIELEISDTSALSQFTTQAVPVLGLVTGSAHLRQREGPGFSLDDILLRIDSESLQLRASGRIADLLGFTGVQLTTDFSHLPVNALTALSMDALPPSRHLGDLEGSFQLRGQGRQWHFPRLEVRTSAEDGPVSLSAVGNIRHLTGQPSADLDIKFHIRDPVLLEELSGLKLNPTQGNLRLQSETSDLTALGRARIGETHLELKGKLSRDENTITQLTLALTSPRLRMRDLGLQAQEDGAAGYVPADRLAEIETEPFVDRLLRQSPPYPVDIAVALDSIVGENTNIQQLHIHTTGIDDRYTLRRFDLMYEESLAELRGIIDLNSSPPFVSIAGEAIAVPMSTLGRDLGLNENVNGFATVRGGLSAQGTSREEIVGNLDGSLALALENAVIAGAAYDVLATDFLAWIYSGAATEKSTKIDCTMGKFQLLDGVARSDSLYIETDKMVATGTAVVDMVREKMDVQFTPRSKSRAIQVPSAIRLKGSFDDPRPIISPITAAADAYAEFLTLLPRITMKLFGVRIGKKKARRPCEPGR